LLKEITVQKIRTFLWFNDNAEGGQILHLVFKTRRSWNVPSPGGKPLGFSVQLEGQVHGLNGGPSTRSPAISLFVNCETAGVDDLWASSWPAAAGKHVRLAARQVRAVMAGHPATLGKLMQDKDRNKAGP
jgi:predicted 3-demethylubiquinone-9 3-methyltransferase (glyoxalase superfamily)